MSEIPIEDSYRNILIELQKRVRGEIGGRKKDPEREAIKEQVHLTAPGAPTGSVEEGVDLQIMKEESRMKVRAFVESQPPVLQFLMEAAPATLGTLGGAATPIPGGAAAGGFGGEAIGQELGISPRSDVGLILSGVGGPAGKLVGKGLRATRRGIAKAGGGIIPARVALARKAMKDAAGEFESIATRVIASKKGLIKTPADVLYKLVEKTGIKIPAFRTTSTRGAFAPLLKELEQFKTLPEVRQAQRLLIDLEKTMQGGTVGFAELAAVREIAGVAIRKAVGATKSKKVKGAFSQFYKAVSDDIDHLATLGGKTGGAAKILQAAGQRAKLDFAIKDFEQISANYIEFIPATNTLKMNVVGFRKALRNATNPKHKNYNKKMTEALKDDLPDMQDRLRQLTTFADASPGGPGSLIVRGFFAKAGSAVVGGAIGLGTVGPVGGAVGAILGARAPEAITAILSSGPAIKFLEAVTKLGTKPITPKMWEIAGQLAAQGTKVSDPRRRSGLEGRSELGVGAP
jgi:hypothetical protein